MTMKELGSDLADFLREEERRPDDAFVRDVDWLIALEVDRQARTRGAARRWTIDLGSAAGVAAVSYAVAMHGQEAPSFWAMASGPWLAAVIAPTLWLITRQSATY